MTINTCPYTKSDTSDPQAAKSLGSKNIIALHTANRDYIEPHTAPFSIKYVLKGTEVYTYEKQTLSVRPHKYLIINKNQTYSSAIDSIDPTSSFCVFFSDEFVSDALQFATSSTEYLLENPSVAPMRELNFDQKLFWLDTEMCGLLGRHHHDSYLKDDLKTDEWCSQLLALLISTHKNEKVKRSNVKAIRHSTREEIFKRLCYAVDFIHEFFTTSISLAQLSKVSCLSKFHFLRTFHQAFKVTPHQYITALRLQYACKLLKETDLTISDICLANGYRDESSFVRLFQSKIGVTPGLFKRTH
jgi:AraC family transcriptional regulator